MISYWEQESFLRYDNIVIGAGITGLSTAIELRERFPRERVLVLERGLLPAGASTRNAGFACMGSATELLDDLQHSTEEEVVHLFARRKQGLDMLRQRLGDAAIGYRSNGSYELIRQEELYALDKLDYLNDLLRPLLGRDAYRPAGDRLDASGFSRQHTEALIENTCEGELHTGHMMRALTDLALQKGVEIKTGAWVRGFEEEEKAVVVLLADAARGAEATLKLLGGRLILCTNAFTPSLLPDAPVKPGRGQVLITHPIPGLRFKGVYHFDRGYYYFREIDGRVLLGGGRNLDFEGETTTELALNDRIQQDLEQKLEELILPGTPFTIDRRWSGIMAFGPTRQPIVKAFSERVFGAFRMGGMGVALGSAVAKDVATLASSIS